jgi:hypothetical protein
MIALRVALNVGAVVLVVWGLSCCPLLIRGLVARRGRGRS